MERLRLEETLEVLWSNLPAMGREACQLDQVTQSTTRKHSYFTLHFSKELLPSKDSETESVSLALGLFTEHSLEWSFSSERQATHGDEKWEGMPLPSNLLHT